jgi:hypothetical protein
MLAYCGRFREGWFGPGHAFFLGLFVGFPVVGFVAAVFFLTGFGFGFLSAVLDRCVDGFAAAFVLDPDTRFNFGFLGAALVRVADGFFIDLGLAAVFRFGFFVGDSVAVGFLTPVKNRAGSSPTTRMV